MLQDQNKEKASKDISYSYVLSRRIQPYPHPPWNFFGLTPLLGVKRYGWAYFGWAKKIQGLQQYFSLPSTLSDPKGYGLVRLEKKDLAGYG